MSATRASARPPARRIVALSDRLYRALLLAYPAGFRQTYGAEMAQVFRTCCREAARADGLGGVLRLWVDALRDLAATALAERLAGGEDMTRSRMLRGTALVGVAGGALWLLMLGGIAVWAILMALQGQPVLFTNAVSGQAPSLSWLDWVAVVGLPSIWAFVLIGLVGLHARLAERGGRIGWLIRLTFVVAAVGALMLFVGGVYMAVNYALNMGNLLRHLLCPSLAPCQEFGKTVDYVDYIDQYLLEMGFLGYLVLGAGMIASGILAVRGRLLPRHNALVLVMGVLVAAQYFFTDMGAPSLLRNTGLPGLIVMAVELLSFIVVWSIGWIVLGRQLWRPPAETEPAGTTPAPATPLAPAVGS